MIKMNIKLFVELSVQFEGPNPLYRRVFPASSLPKSLYFKSGAQNELKPICQTLAENGLNAKLEQA